MLCSRFCGSIVNLTIIVSIHIFTLLLGGSCFAISVGSIYNWQDQLLTIPGSDVVFFFAAIHIRRWSLNIPLTPCSISSCSLVKNTRFFRCVCVKELVFLEPMFLIYGGDKELTKIMYCSTKSQMVLLNLVLQLDGWTCWNRNNPWNFYHSPHLHGSVSDGIVTIQSLRDQLKSPERCTDFAYYKTPWDPAIFVCKAFFFWMIFSCNNKKRAIEILWCLDLFQPWYPSMFQNSRKYMEFCGS